MNEYNIENGKKAEINKLRTTYIDKEIYSKIHELSSIVTHDIFIEYEGGILLVMRDNVPAKNELFPIGGRTFKGTPMEDSLKMKAKEECGLEIKEISYLGVARMFFETDPFGHGKGTDTVTLAYRGKGKGKIKLNKLHKGYVIVNKKNWTPDFRAKLHPYVREFMDIVIEKIDG